MTIRMIRYAHVFTWQASSFVDVSPSPYLSFCVNGNTNHGKINMVRLKLEAKKFTDCRRLSDLNRRRQSL